jgi:metal-responsive CopG/Arc/MetJ family transcriptional regulator
VFNLKEQVAIQLETDLISYIDTYLEKVTPKYRNRSHFFEVVLTDFINKNQVDEENALRS